MAYRPTEKTEARKKAQRKLLLDSALTIVSGDGFQALTIVALAEKAGVATGTVYKYFDNKAHLCREVFRIASGREVTQVKRAAFPGQAASCRQRLTDAINSFAERAIAGHKIAYALIAEPVDPLVEAERLKYRRAYADIFVRLLEEGVEKDEFQVRDAGVAAAALVGALAETLVGPLKLAAGDNAGPDPQELLASIRSFCLNAVSS